MPTLAGLKQRNSIHSSIMIANFVAIASILLFAWLALPIGPSRWGARAVLRFENGAEAAVMILTIALILLSWRRAVDLQRAARDSEAARYREHQLAYMDEVTGLRNRRFLIEKLLPTIKDAPCTLIMLDLDGFKKVNDLYGHDTGDQLLVEVAKRLKDVVGNEGTAFRLGGDEFAILLLSDAADICPASKLAIKIVESVSQPISIGSTIASVGASLGLSTTEESDDDITTLLHRSDIAMYEAKRLGRNRHVWFDADMGAKLNARNLVEIEIRTGIVEGQFVPYFQPMLDLCSGEVKGYEVLARWNHPSRGMVLPDDFIPIAEASGQISDLSHSVIGQALEQASAWPGELTISVNISPVQFKDPLLAQRVLKLLAQTGFPPSRLEIEITESAIVEDRSLALTIIRSFKKAGIRISLDDFGTGYASLSQLNELPFDRIKIDKSFIAGIQSNSQNRAIVEAITALGKSLSMPVTAEGVEEDEIRDMLLALGCSDAQGWLFGKAVSGEEISSGFGIPGKLSKTLYGRSDLKRPNQDRRDYYRRGSRA